MNLQQDSSKVGMSVIGSLFFIFGFATTFVITLSAKVKDLFSLSEFQAQLLNFAFFITYALLSIPIGLCINTIGYKRSLILGLALMAMGGFLFYPASHHLSFPLFLGATFVLATGVVALQTAANPYVIALGPENSAPSRLNLVQGLNSVATMVAPWGIAALIFKDAGQSLTPQEQAQAVQMPFILMSIVVILIAFIVMSVKLPEIGQIISEKKQVWKYPHVLLGALAIFFYTGAEVGNGSLIINYLRVTGDIDAHSASKYVAIYWGGAMVGRFFGAFTFSNISWSKKIVLVFLIVLLALFSGAFVTDWNWRVGTFFGLFSVVNFLIMQLGLGRSARTLALFTLMAALLDMTTTFSTGAVSLWALVSIGLFNSIMFPNIFTLALKDLDKGELSTASGIINTMIFGGAIIPPIMGWVADSFGHTWVFLVPALSYLYIFFYAIKGCKLRVNNLSF